jgi:hypothetical protein
VSNLTTDVAGLVGWARFTARVLGAVTFQVSKLTTDATGLGRSRVGVLGAVTLQVANLTTNVASLPGGGTSVFVIRAISSQVAGLATMVAGTFFGVTLGTVTLHMALHAAVVALLGHWRLLAVTTNVASFTAVVANFVLIWVVALWLVRAITLEVLGRATKVACWSGGDLLLIHFPFLSILPLTNA